MVPIPKIVIAGGGIVGNSIAYFLAQRRVPVTLIDPVGIASCASGKAGGFLAKDWRDGTPLQEFQREGFDLHQDLADCLGPSVIDYRRLTCKAVAVDASKRTEKPSNRKSKNLEWVDHGGVAGTSSMGGKQTIAQVHPKKLCQELWKYSESQGSTLKIGKVIKVLTTSASSGGATQSKAEDGTKEEEEESERLEAIELDDGTTIPADKLVIACGPWTEKARYWFPEHLQWCWPEITGVKCHSVLVQAPQTLSEAVFFERPPSSRKSRSAASSKDQDGETKEEKLLTTEQLSSVEVYPRPDGDAYVNGLEGDEVLIEEEPGKEVVEPDAVKNLELALGQTSSMLKGLEAHTKQVCYWPETPDGLPILDRIDDFLGGSTYVAAGHSVWGILQGPISGKAMSELILDGKSTCVDLSPFRLDRFEYDDEDGQDDETMGFGGSGT